MRDVLGHRMRQEAVKYAVSRRIFCECGSILDMRRSVLITRKDGGGGASVSCGTCFDRAAERFGLDRIREAFDVDDGRELWSRKS